MLIDEADIKPKLSTLLAPICDADPDVLADYVIALLRHDKPTEELHSLCISQLDDFLKHETIPFVNKLFDLLSNKRKASDNHESTEFKYLKTERQGFDRDRQLKRCRDYDEKGVCMRGDLCPYEHGADRIVVDEASIGRFGIPPVTDPFITEAVSQANSPDFVQNV